MIMIVSKRHKINKNSPNMLDIPFRHYNNTSAFTQKVSTHIVLEVEVLYQPITIVTPFHMKPIIQAR